jgi:hypothetical protein
LNRFDLQWGKRNPAMRRRRVGDAAAKKNATKVLETFLTPAPYGP